VTDVTHFSRFILQSFSTLAFCVCFGFAAQAEVLNGLVIGLADGDTLTVLTPAREQVKVRLAGIDAPEKAQAFGSQSRQALAEFAFRKNVQVSWTKKDRYGRVIGVVYLGGKDAGLELIRRGLAWHYKHYEFEQRPEQRAAYSAAEEKARSAHLGIWQDKEPTAPWDFRSQKKRRQ
jgi:endonuclease YncB( thermonuclease family)